MPRIAGTVACACLLLAVGTTASAQSSARRLATIEGLRQYPGFFHLQNVLLRGEVVENGSRIALRSETGEMRLHLADGVRSTSGLVEVRAQLVDVGRLETDDPRAAAFPEGRDKDRWPRPGEELYLRVTAVTSAENATNATVRTLALEPWKFAGKTVTVVGNFRGRNLFGDQPGAPGQGRYDFVLRGTEGAIWVTGQQPKGRGFDLDVNRRIDTNQWLEVTGTVAYDRGLVTIAATRLTATKPLSLAALVEEKVPTPPPPPVEIVFSSPSEGEADVSPTGSIRIQFSKGLNPNGVKTGFRVTYIGGPDEAAQPEGPTFGVSYDPATRSVQIKFAQPLQPARTVKVEILDSLTGFDGATVDAWSMTFSVGS